MNKQEILDEISKTKEHLANMEKMLEECENKRWKPKEGEKFFFIDAWSRACYENYKETNRCCYEYHNTYNCFKTEKEAHAEAEKILVRRMLEDIARRLNKGRKIDWESHEYKFHLVIFNDVISQEICRNIKYQGTVYCLDGNFKDIAIQEIGEKRLKSYLRGE